MTIIVRCPYCGEKIEVEINRQNFLDQMKMKPNPNVKPPRFCKVTEGYNPQNTGNFLNESKDK